MSAAVVISALKVKMSSVTKLVFKKFSGDGIILKLDYSCGFELIFS